MALSDKEVDKQINHMVQFIDREAQEKVEEIDAKAEEEFNIEKGRLLRQEKLKVKNYFERKEKQIDMQRKIQRSNMQNKARLSVLKARDDHVDKVLSEVARSIGDITANRESYINILTALIAQGLFQLIEPKVYITCKQKDIELIEAAIPEAIKKYKEATKADIIVEIEKHSFLPEGCNGGVIMKDQTRCISVTNTFESRLKLISEQMVPEIRAILFGSNPQRKFFD